MTDVCVSGQPDHRQLAAICILVLMARAAIAEIILGLGIGVLPDDGNSGDARRGEVGGDIGGDVEHRMAGLARGEEAFVRGVVGEEVLNEAVIDLVGGASDARADRGGDMGAARSEEHTSELQSLMRISYAVFCLKKKNVMQE